jgi:hypothetical protein
VKRVCCFRKGAHGGNPFPPCVLTLVAGLAAGATLLAAPPAAAAKTPAQRLAARYAPVMQLKHNDDPPCSTSGEQYTPTSVETILGNPDVELVRIEKRKKAVIVKRGATARDIAHLDGEYYLNQPGNPYRPRCRFARDSERLTRGRPPVIYAHLARQPGVPKIALQYWFYYWFNHFNDLHESDWEMIQLVFDAETVSGALARGPSEIAYAQHGGGERADWDDSKVEKENATHPVVYVASGSHASQYDSALYLGRGRQGAGLGCDDTRKNGYFVTVKPTPAVVPTFPSSAAGTFAWLAYEGHWGQHARGFSNGVTGPNTKKQWVYPFAWMDGLRTSTPRMPVSESAGTTVTSFFCNAIIAVASAGNYVGGRTWVLGLLLMGLLLATTLPVSRTTWRPAPHEPLRQERAAGQLLRVAGRLYRQYALTLLSIVLVIIAVAFGITRILQFLASNADVHIELPLGDPGVDSFTDFLLAAPAYPIFLLVVGAPIVVALRRIDAGEPTVPWTVFREVIPLVPRLLWAEFLALFAVGLLSLTVIGIPVAIKKSVDWTFAAQEIVFERRKARAALAASSKRVRGRWWSIAGVDLALFFVGAVIGPLGGAALIILTDVPLWTINFVGLAFFGLVLPYMIITLTLMYLDPRRQEAAAPGRWRRRLAFWRRDASVPARAAGS